VSTSTDDSRLAVVATWTGRVVACFILILGALVFVTFTETGLVRDLVYAVLGLGGALLFIVGLERSRPSSRWVQLAGWLMMAAFSLIPTSLLFIPMIAVLAALPGLFHRFQRSWYASGRRPSVGQHPG
jgi:chromate transport protein ChrA